MSLPRSLCVGALDEIANQLGLAEIQSAELTSAMDGSTVGVHRVLGGPASASGVTIVYVAMTVEAFGLDSHMMFAFTPETSAVPHFTIDSVNAGEHYAFHLDLIPRIDPGANLGYLDHCFTPLTEAHDGAAEIEGLTRAHLAPRQWQLMSAWMLAHRADQGAFANIGPTVDAYRDHWLGLVRNGVPAALTSSVTPDQLRVRDRANRAAIFSPDVDPVWAQVDRLLGADVSADIQQSLRTAGTTA